MERSTKHIDFLDHIRGIAILSVFLVHAFGLALGRSTLPWATWHADFGVSKSFLILLPFSYGWAGVAIFFVVSGFCIHFSFKQHPDWRAFYLRRFFRIYPPYLFALLLFAVVIPWTRVGYTLLHKVFQIGIHLALLNNLHDQSFGSINPNFWSVAVEAQLYLLYPLLLLAVSRWGWGRCLFCLAILEFGLREVVRQLPAITGQAADNWWQGMPVIHSWILGFPMMYWFSWSIGAAIADAYLAGRPIPFARHSMLMWGTLAFGSYLIKDTACFTFTFFSLLTATGIARLLQKNYLLFIPELLSKPLRLAGIVSYSLYLLHWPFLSRAPWIAEKLHLSNCLNPAGFFVFCLVLGLPIFALAAAWYKVFELPSIAAGKQIIRWIKSAE